MIFFFLISKHITLLFSFVFSIWIKIWIFSQFLSLFSVGKTSSCSWHRNRRITFKEVKHSKDWTCIWYDILQQHLNHTYFNYTLETLNTDTEGRERSVRIREVSVWKRSLWWRHFYDSSYSFNCSVAITRLTLVFKQHLKLLIHNTTLSFSSIEHCTSQL